MKNWPETSDWNQKPSTRSQFSPITLNEANRVCWHCLASCGIRSCRPSHTQAWLHSVLLSKTFLHRTMCTNRNKRWFVVSFSLHPCWQNQIELLHDTINCWSRVRQLIPTRFNQLFDRNGQWTRDRQSFAFENHLCNVPRVHHFDVRPLLRHNHPQQNAKTVNICAALVLLVVEDFYQWEVKELY